MSNLLQKYFEIYVQKDNTSSLALVVGGYLGVNGSDNISRNLILFLRGQFNTDKLVEDEIILWLEPRVHEDSVEPATQKTIAKIYIDFLMENQYYDSKMVGMYC